jgi:hypothetical protein
MYSIISNKNFWPERQDKAAHFADLFQRLEQNPDKLQRVETILGLLSELRDDLSTLDKVRVLTGLRNALHHYRWVSQISPTREGFRAILIPADREKLSHDDEWEYGAVRDLLEITLEDGALSRLRRCAYDGCKGWFYANKSNQEWCTRGTCRQNHYFSNPENQEKHRASVKKYDAGQRERNRIIEERSRQGRTPWKRKKARKRNIR